MQATENPPPIVAVDWDTIEDDIETEIGEDRKRAVEHVGFDKSNTSVVDEAVSRHGAIVHPNRGPLDSLYAPISGNSYLLSVFRAIAGTCPFLKYIDMDSTDAFMGGVGDLYDAARKLTKRGGDWYDGRQPVVKSDGVGDNLLDGVYIRFSHPEQTIIKQLDTDDLPIECNRILGWDAPTEHYTVTYVHESCEANLKSSDEPIPSEKFAWEIGLFGKSTDTQINLSKQIISDFDSVHNSAGHEQFLERISQPLPSTAPYRGKLYRFKDEDSNPHGFDSPLYAFQWSEFPSKSHLVGEETVHTFFFGEWLDADSVKSALLLDRHHSDEPRGGQYPSIKPPSASKVAHTLRTASSGDHLQLDVYRGEICGTITEKPHRAVGDIFRNITTGTENPHYVPPTWDGHKQENGSLSVTLRVTETEGYRYRWLEQENKLTEVTATESHGWEFPSATAWKSYDLGMFSVDNTQIDLGEVTRIKNISTEA